MYRAVCVSALPCGTVIKTLKACCSGLFNGEQCCCSRQPIRYTGMSRSGELECVYSKAKELVSVAIKAVSPMPLVSHKLQFDSVTNILTVENETYKLSRNVKVVAFGKAVLGMVTAVECILGDHIKEGIASVPVGAVQTAKDNSPNFLPSKNTKIRVYEGAFNNLPDEAAELTARKILKMVSEAGEEDIILILVSGGGSALLPCPIEGVTLAEKRQVIESLARGGANVHELNMFRKALSQTKGGQLARAAYPSKLISLVLSDVIGNPLDIIASGPTVPNLTSCSDVLAILDKYRLREHAPQSVSSYLTSCERQERRMNKPIVPISNTQYTHTQNVLLGTNSIATEATLSVSKNLGIDGHIWSHSIQGEAKVLGDALAVLVFTHLNMNQSPSPTEGLGKQSALLEDICQNLPDMKESFLKLNSMLECLQQEHKLVCFVSGGEPTVTVTGQGRGGRNQEMALAFAIKLHELKKSDSDDNLLPRCVFVSVGTDGQDGPCDAAGAIVDCKVVSHALEQGLDPHQYLTNNDSYNFFLKLDNGKHHIKTGLTGTNVMDIQLILLCK